MKARRAPSGPFIKTLSVDAPANANPNAGATLTLDWSQGSLFRFTLDQAACVITSTGLPPGEYVNGLKVEFVQGAGGFKAVLFLNAKTPGGQGTQLSNVATALDVVSLFWDGYQLFAEVDGLDWG